MKERNEREDREETLWRLLRVRKNQPSGQLLGCDSVQQLCKMGGHNGGETGRSMNLVSQCYFLQLHVNL